MQQPIGHLSITMNTSIPCIYFPVSGELLSLFFGFHRMVLQNLQKIIGYTLEQKLPLECLWLTRWSPFVCIDSICSQFKSPLTIISITAALFFVPLRALSFITPIMSILVFFSGESRRLVLFVVFLSRCLYPLTLQS